MAAGAPPQGSCEGAGGEAAAPQTSLATAAGGAAIAGGAATAALAVFISCDWTGADGAPQGSAAGAAPEVLAAAPQALLLEAG